MKIGIIPLNVGVFEPSQITSLAQKAEEVGVESVWTFEHAMVPVDYESRYPYSSKGKMPATPETPFVDPLIALTYAAAATRKLRLATGVNILPQSSPLMLAKQAASLDFVSNGRLMLGLGIGWLKEEFDALGVPFERRGARYNDYVHAMKKVWSGEVVEHESDFIHWKNFKSYPLPTQKPHPPIIVGGTSRRALERVVELGDGWFAPSANADGLAPMIDQLKSAAKEAGRDYESIEISATWDYGREGLDSLKKYEDLGVSRLVVATYQLGDAPLPGLDKLGDAVISKL